MVSTIRKHYLYTCTRMASLGTRDCRFAIPSRLAYPSDNGRTDGITKQMGNEYLNSFGCWSSCRNNGVLLCVCEGVDVVNRGNSGSSQSLLIYQQHGSHWRPVQTEEELRKEHKYLSKDNSSIKLIHQYSHTITVCIQFELLHSNTVYPILPIPVWYAWQAGIIYFIVTHCKSTGSLRYDWLVNEFGTRRCYDARSTFDYTVYKLYQSIR